MNVNGHVNASQPSTSGGPAHAPDAIKYSSRFNASNAEVTFRSSDQVLFKIHIMNLKAVTESFFPPECATFDDIVDLTESSEVLDVLFQFIYPMRHPDLEWTEFPKLQALSEAAEKYQVYSAITVCKIRMKSALTLNPPAVMSYAMKHGYPDIMDAAAPLLIAYSLTDALSPMPVQYMPVWIRYHDCWLQTVQTAMSFYKAPERPLFSFGPPEPGTTLSVGIKCPNGSCKSEPMHQRIVNALCDLGGKVGALRDLDSLFGPVNDGFFVGCMQCQARFRDWKKETQENVDRIPKFSTFL